MFAFAFALALTLTPTAGEKYQQPQLAARDGKVGVVFGAGSTIYYAPVGGESAPRKVATVAKLALGRHRGPRLAITGDGALVVAAVVGRKAGEEAVDLVAWRSTDGGKTWSSGAAINDVPTAPREGLHALAAGPGGQVYAAWLDLRDKGTRLMSAASSDGGVTWSANRLVYASPDGHICECCHPSLTVGADGTVAAMWRNWVGGMRDLYVARSSDQGKTWQAAEKSGQGSWPLNACPMDGGGLGVGPDGKTVAAWRRDGSVYLAQGKQAEQKLGDGKDAAIALTPSGPYVLWSTPQGLMLATPGANTPRLVEQGATYPSLAGSGPVYGAWEKDGRVVVQKLSE